ncbi:MAG: hypothetical protein EB100_07125, partial [Crocinitomicaceae bacterium]|nr:hypothetical protein [Crocinitomicaceae bacterium]
PDTPGTYTVRIWHDANANLLYDSGEATRTVTVYAGAAPATATFTQYGATSSVTGAAANALELGSLVLLSLKDASGNPTTLGTNEGLTITATGSATLSVDNWSNAVAGTTGITLTSSTSPSAYGMYRLNIKDTVAETSTITISGAGSLAGVVSTHTTTATFVDVVDEDAAPASNAMTTGTDATAIGAVTSVSNGTDIALSSATKTATITFTSAAASTATRYVGMAVYDTTGAITGYPTAGYTDVVSISGTAAGTATKSFTATYWSSTTRARTNASGADSFVVSTLDISGTATEGRGAEYIATAAANNATNSSFNVTNVSATAGGQVSVTLTVKDQFGVARAGQAVTFVIAGRNALNTAVANFVTDAGGQATFTYTDIGTATSSTTDSISVSGLAVTGVTVSFAAGNAVSSVLLDSDDTTAGVANPVKAPQGVIQAGTAGAAASAGRKTISATVTNAAGTALVGVPCVWTVAGEGAAILSTTKTTYTNALGVCTTSVYAWIA